MTPRLLIAALAASIALPAAAGECWTCGPPVSYRGAASAAACSAGELWLAEFPVGLEVAPDTYTLLALCDGAGGVRPMTAEEALAAYYRPACRATLYTRYLAAREQVATSPQIADCALDIPSAEECALVAAGLRALNTAYAAARAEIAEADAEAAAACTWEIAP